MFERIQTHIMLLALLTLLQALVATSFAPPAGLSSCRGLRHDGRSKVHVSMSSRAVGELGIGHLQKDVVVVGGGLAGLSVALELARKGRHVTVLSRDIKEAASCAAGGMIAPQAERLPDNNYLNLCVSSRGMFSSWVEDLETLASCTVGPGEVLSDVTDTGFWSGSGFIAPAFEGDAVHQWQPPESGGQSHWLGRSELLSMEPLISEDAVGGWWFPQDMNVDAVKLFKVLKRACHSAGVEILENVGARGLVYDAAGTRVRAVVLSDGRQAHATAVVAATGAWLRELTSVPMEPHKGQMMSLKVPESAWGSLAKSQRPSPLNRVLFAADAYIIPKRDGRIVVGATIEPGVWDLHTTPAGMSKLMASAMKVCPQLGDYAIEETWAGLRPVTPDYWPVLGGGQQCENLFVAGGYWRNGVCLAPKTGQLVADAVMGTLSDVDERLMNAFSMDRFLGLRGTEAASTVSSPSIMSSPSAVNGVSSATSEASRTPSLTEVSADEAQAFELAAAAGIEAAGHSKTSPADAWPAALPTTAAPLTWNEDTDDASDGPVTDYDASEEYNEEAMKRARQANRNLDEVFADFEEKEYKDLGPEAFPAAWEPGAAQVAQQLGAKLMPVDEIPGGEDVLDDHTPFATITWHREEGGDVQVPFGTNVYEMARAGEVAVPGCSPPAESLDGTNHVIGDRDRSAEVESLYETVLKNKQKSTNGEANGAANGAANGEAKGLNGSSVSARGLGGLGGKIFSSLLKGPVGAAEKTLEDVPQERSHQPNAELDSYHEEEGAGPRRVLSEEEIMQTAGEASFDAYDFILTHRDAQDGGDDTAEKARRSNRLDPDEEQDRFEAIAAGFTGPADAGDGLGMKHAGGGKLNKRLLKLLLSGLRVVTKAPRLGLHGIAKLLTLSL
ncbi:unnamed protein product [Chrysoparadoxa australica]